MKKIDILMAISCETPIQLTHSCMTENGIEQDEIFLIRNILGDFEQLLIVNQYNQEIIINPNQIKE